VDDARKCDREHEQCGEHGEDDGFRINGLFGGHLVDPPQARIVSNAPVYERDKVRSRTFANRGRREEPTGIDLSAQVALMRTIASA
jgi:hypothetical protein